MSCYFPLAAANEFIARSEGRGVSHMKLQKLVYLSLEEWLKTHDRSFLSRNPEVWQYGPVFSDLYHEFKGYRSAPIKDLGQIFDVAPRVEDKEVLNTFDRVWGKYQLAPATYLSDLTHRPGSPWYQIAKKHKFSVPFGTEIPTETIKQYARDEAKAVA